ncbi:TPA: type-F conjugative transfer system pilin assembly protein TrbC [Proteus mirabilis]|nr:type-F conjugative transfer system pilin assembly protein TrbC [Proteus mirabilis]MBG2905371.1 type-F conjugative transfer system pilin assembly protein TrbC [Proteus mirabilis]MBG3156675.1 type-F conjugative transfer system pilin assembly protein TrbC [Proteus mirabilis]MBG5994285.1 type-F conjugative transfer system pilin assembly protein TrbC [Proteus mirabilis]MBI6207641.1 type-F conjugative transfer system pilin assembly protein TrbC [Proteus mirabilis]
MESPNMEENKNEVAYFLSSSIPEKTLASLIRSAESQGIPVYFNGLIDDSVDKTAKYMLYLVQKYKISGVEIDPNRFEYYGVRAVPALVKRCGGKFDIIYGSGSISGSLSIIDSEGDCKNEK